MSKGALHRMAGLVAVELGDRGIAAFNLSPGFVATERIAQDMAAFGFDASAGAPADVVGAVAAWLATSPEARQRNGAWIEAQEVCRDLGPATGMAAGPRRSLTARRAPGRMAPWLPSSRSRPPTSSTPCSS